MIRPLSSKTPLVVCQRIRFAEEKTPKGKWSNGGLLKCKKQNKRKRGKMYLEQMWVEHEESDFP